MEIGERVSQEDWDQSTPRSSYNTLDTYTKDFASYHRDISSDMFIAFLLIIARLETAWLSTNRGCVNLHNEIFLKY